MLAASSSALAIEPFIPFDPSVSSIVAPYALRIFLLSTLIVSGIVRITLYPFAVPTDASPIPVLPDVASIMVEPGFNLPSFSAASIIASAILSFTEPAGLKYSSFTKTLALRPSSLSIFETSTNGVLPINSLLLL